MNGVGAPLPFPQPVPDQAVIQAVLAARPAMEQMQQSAAAAVTPPNASEGTVDVYA